MNHKTNYFCDFGEDKRYDSPTFKKFMALVEGQFNFRIYMLRTDGGGEYPTLDLFCDDTVIFIQISESGNQASNGKAERMHCTITTIVQIMIFARDLSLTFWGDAARYAGQILDRRPSTSNAGRQSLL